MFSFIFQQYSETLLLLFMKNHTNYNTEIYGKILLKAKDVLFQDKIGFYGNESNILLQPFILYHGNIDLKNLKNNKNEKLADFLKQNKVDLIEFTFQIKYRKFRLFWWKHLSYLWTNLPWFWKKSIIQKYKYNLLKNEMWQDN